MESGSTSSGVGGSGARGEADRLADFLREPGPRLIHVHGCEGSGKTRLVRSVLAALPPGRPRLHLDIAPLDEPMLLELMEAEARDALGPLPDPDRPDLLPLPGLAARWARLLEGMLSGAAGDRAGDPAGEPPSGAPAGVVVLDGFEWLIEARRRIAGELAEVWDRIVRRGLPVRLVVVSRAAELPGDLKPDGSVEVGALSYRVAGWAHGGRDPLDAFRRWAIFGDHAANLSRGRRVGTTGAGVAGAPRRGEPDPRSLAGAVIDRVLRPSGDLHDAPLRRLRQGVQAPGRYAAILRAVSEEDRDWSGIGDALGGGGGSRVAPYIQRLEGDARLRVRLPLDAPPDARRRRYAPVDPFDAFWFGLVLPVRSRLLRDDPRVVWSEAIEPRLPVHFTRWLAEAGRRWLAEHAAEQLPAEARDAGSVWGGEGPEFAVAGRLRNGQVCYGSVQPESAPAGAGLLEELQSRMEQTRWGIGRQARAPLLFLQGEPEPALRRQAARIPLAELIEPVRLMGEGA